MDGRRQRLADARARRQTAIDAIMDARRKRLEDGPQFHSEYLKSEDGAFQKLETKLSHEKGIRNPAAVAAAAGREKYGESGMEKKSEAGRK